MEIYLIQRINLDTAHKRIWDVGNQYENKRALYVIGDTLKKQNKAKQNNKNNKKPSSELPGGHCKEKTPSYLESFLLADWQRICVWGKVCYFLFLRKKIFLLDPIKRDKQRKKKQN